MLRPFGREIVRKMGSQLKVDYDEDLHESYIIWGADIFTLLKLGRTLQDWVNEVGLRGYVTACIESDFADGSVRVEVDPRHPAITLDGLKETRRKLKELTEGAEWNLVTEEMKEKIWYMANYGDKWKQKWEEKRRK